MAQFREKEIQGQLSLIKTSGVRSLSEGFVVFSLSSNSVHCTGCFLLVLFEILIQPISHILQVNLSLYVGQVGFVSGKNDWNILVELTR